MNVTLTTKDLLAHARKCISENPKLSSAELKAELNTYYFDQTGTWEDLVADAPRDSFIGVKAGAVANPLDWVRGGALILKGAAKMLSQKKIDGKSVAEVVDGIVTIVKKEQSAK